MSFFNFHHKNDSPGHAENQEKQPNPTPQINWNFNPTEQQETWNTESEQRKEFPNNESLDNIIEEEPFKPETSQNPVNSTNQTTVNTPKENPSVENPSVENSEKPLSKIKDNPPIMENKFTGGVEKQNIEPKHESSEKTITSDEVPAEDTQKQNPPFQPESAPDTHTISTKSAESTISKTQSFKSDKSDNHTPENPHKYENKVSFSHSDTEIPGEAYTEQYISLNNLRPSKLNRGISETDIDSLKESIRNIGLTDDLVVCKEDGYYEILAGHRRFKALTELVQEGDIRFRTIQCKIVNLDDIDLPVSREQKKKYIHATTNTETRNQTAEDQRILLKNLEEVYNALKAQGEAVGNKMEFLAEKTGLSRQAISASNKIERGIIPELKEYFHTQGEPSKNQLLHITKYSDKRQKKLLGYLIDHNAKGKNITKSFLHTFEYPPKKPKPDSTEMVKTDSGSAQSTTEAPEENIPTKTEKNENNTKRETQKTENPPVQSDPVQAKSQNPTQNLSGTPNTKPVTNVHTNKPKNEAPVNTQKNHSAKSSDTVSDKTHNPTDNSPQNILRLYHKILHGYATQMPENMNNNTPEYKQLLKDARELERILQDMNQKN